MREGTMATGDVINAAQRVEATVRAINRIGFTGPRYTWTNDGEGGGNETATV